MATEVRALEVTAIDRPARDPSNYWLISPAFDLLFLANAAWPVLLLIPGIDGSGRSTPLEFAQTYFLTTPHRWITLALVAADPDRREGRSLRFLAILTVVSLITVGVRLSQAQFLCLLLVDFVWNAWHFGAQHSGLLRIYGRKLGEDYSAFEKHGIRLLVLLSILRIPDWSDALLARSNGLAALADGGLLLLAISLAGRGVAASGGRLNGKSAYTLSVCLLYGLLALSRMWQDHATQSRLFLAATIFHATEYLAIVTLYARRRVHGGSRDVFQAMAGRWGLVLSAFVLLSGTLDFLARSAFFELAAGLNLGAAFLHYAYDGMIWKLRRPATARSLGV